MSNDFFRNPWPSTAAPIFLIDMTVGKYCSSKVQVFSDCSPVLSPVKEYGGYTYEKRRIFSSRFSPTNIDIPYFLQAVFSFKKSSFRVRASSSIILTNSRKSLRLCPVTIGVSDRQECLHLAEAV